MTSAEAISKFSYLLDTRSSPNFDNDEVLSFLNSAQLEFLARMFPDGSGQGVINFDFDRNTLSTLKQLIYTFSISADQSSGDSSRYFYSSILTALRTLSGDITSTIFRFANLSVVSTTTPYAEIPVKYKRLNDLASSTVNYFKKPAETNRFYILEAPGSIRCFPAISSQLTIRLIKNPVPMTIANSPEFDDSAMNSIISIALQYAGVGSRDQELTGQILNSKISN
jgi:hypothetical protein